MLDKDYTKTFEFAKAYAELGIQERKIIEYLFTKDIIFRGGYSKLAKQLKMDDRNLRNILKYLNALGIVYIEKEKYSENLEVKTRNNGKTFTSINKMVFCFIVENWMDILIKQYHNNNIYHDLKKKIIFINETNKKCG